jgi:hypothetical protein
MSETVEEPAESGEHAVAYEALRCRSHRLRVRHPELTA